MAPFTKLSSGSWRVQGRRKGRYVSETFLRRDDARRRATEAERQIDRGEAPNDSRITRLKTFEDLIDLHIDDMCDVGKTPLRSNQGYRIWPTMVLAKSSDHPARFRFRLMGSFGLAVRRRLRVRRRRMARF